MNDNKTPAPPFYLKNTVCPNCRKNVKVFFLPDVTSRLYYPKEKETDLHVTRWEWKNEKFSHINPYYYDLLLCPECCFCDLRDDFLSPDINLFNKVHSIRKIFLKDKERTKSLIPAFVKHISLNHLDFRQAVYFHLLAIYIQELLPGPLPQEDPRMNRDWKKIGKLYLRTSWLLREQRLKEGSALPENIGYLNQLKESIESLHLKNTDLKKNIENVLNFLKKQQNYEIAQNKENHDVYTQYKIYLQSLVQNYHKMHTGIEHLRNEYSTHCSFSQENNKIENSSIKKMKNELMEYQSIWAELDFDETGLLRKAVEYYSLASSSDSTLSDYNGLSLLEFCLRLLKMYELKEEKDSLLMLFSKRSSNIRSILMKKKSKAASRIKRAEIDAEIRKISNLIQDVSFKYKE